MSRHFWILVVGTLAFLVLFLRCLNANHGDSDVVVDTWITAYAIKGAVGILGCYLAFVVVVCGHRLLRPESVPPRAWHGNGPSPSTAAEQGATADRPRVHGVSSHDVKPA
jgi:hypothetical protein